MLPNIKHHSWIKPRKLSNVKEVGRYSDRQRKLVERISFNVWSRGKLLRDFGLDLQLVNGRWVWKGGYRQKWSIMVHLSDVLEITQASAAILCYAFILSEFSSSSLWIPHLWKYLKDLYAPSVSRIFWGSMWR